MFPDSGAQVYSVSLDHFVEAKLALTQNNESKTTAHSFARVNAQTPYNLTTQPARLTGTPTLRHGGRHLSFGHSFSEDRNLSASARLDYGTLEMRGIRTLQYKVEYLGSQNDALRDVRVEDQLKLPDGRGGPRSPAAVAGRVCSVATPGAETQGQLEHHRRVPARGAGA